MSTLEREIIEKFHQLQPSAKKRVLAALTRDVQAPFDYKAWWARTEALQGGLRARLGAGKTVGALALLDELREEES